MRLFFAKDASKHSKVPTFDSFWRFTAKWPNIEQNAPWSIPVEHAACSRKFTLSLAFRRDSVGHLQFNTNPQANLAHETAQHPSLSNFLLKSSLAVPKPWTCAMRVTKSCIIIWLCKHWYDFMSSSPPMKWRSFEHVFLKQNVYKSITRQCTQSQAPVIRCSRQSFTWSGKYLHDFAVNFRE